MTHAEALVAQRVYDRQLAHIDGEDFPLVACNEEGCFLEGKDGKEFFAYWHEITDWNWATRKLAVNAL